MTSHIFIALGMWDDVVAANRRAIAVVDRQNTAAGKPPIDCGHYPLWLHYGLLQQRHFDEARKALDACRASAFSAKFEGSGPMDSPEGRIGSFAEMRAHQVASGGTLTSADDVTIPDTPGYAEARMLMAYTDALVTAKRSDVAALDAAVARVHANETQLLESIAKKNERNPADRIAAETIGHQADALQLLARGKRDEAIALLETTAREETSMPFEFGPPLVPKPTDELLGDALLAAGRPAEAAAAYRKALGRTPGRTVTLSGLDRAVTAAKEAAEPKAAAAH